MASLVTLLRVHYNLISILAFKKKQIVALNVLAGYQANLEYSDGLKIGKYWMHSLGEALF